MRVLVPLARYGFDPTETAVPWKYLKDAEHHLTFATPDGKPGKADVRMVTGQGLGLLKGTLMADAASLLLYRELEESAEFNNPTTYGAIKSGDFDALFIPGGHDKGMREVLESKVLQEIVVEFFEADKPVAAICHGTLLVGRSISPKTQKSVLYGRKSTGLTSWQERTAYYLTRPWLGDYYLTYPQIYMADELKGFLQKPDDFLSGPGFPIPTLRDTEAKPNGFAVRDGNYLSARWPGDAHRFATELVKLLH
jgi:protease I